MVGARTATSPGPSSAALTRADCLDKSESAVHPSGMSESPYAIPEEDLVDSARVPVAEQITEQPERRFYDNGWAGGGGPTGDAHGDADGE